MPDPRAALPAALLGALLGALSLPVAAAAQFAPSARVATFGEVSRGRDLGVRDPRTVEGGAAVHDWGNARVVRRTSGIEARLCGRFGVQFVVGGIPPGGTLDLTIRSSHPPLTHPDGRGDTGVGYSWSVAPGRPLVVGYTFGQLWQLVPGTWTFSILSGKTMLAEQAFEVTVPPDAGQAPDGGCSAPVS